MGIKITNTSKVYVFVGRTRIYWM